MPSARQDLRSRKRRRDLTREKLDGPGGERRERRSTRIRRRSREVGLEAVTHEVAGDEHELRPRRRPLHRRQCRLEERIVGVAPVSGVGLLRGSPEDRAPARHVGPLQRRHQRRIAERIEMQIAEDEHPWRCPGPLGRDGGAIGRQAVATAMTPHNTTKDLGMVIDTLVSRVTELSCTRIAR